MLQQETKKETFMDVEKILVDVQKNLVENQEAEAMNLVSNAQGIQSKVKPGSTSSSKSRKSKGGKNQQKT